MSKIIKGNINKTSFIIEIPQYDGTYTQHKFNSLEDLTNEWNNYIRIRPFYKIVYVSFDYKGDGDKSSHIFHTNYTDSKLVIEKMTNMMKYPIFHLIDKDGNKVYYKNYSDNSYEYIYNEHDLHNVSEYVSYSDLLCSYSFFSTELQEPKKYITATIYSMPDNEIVKTCMFEHHIPKEKKNNIVITICKNFKPLPDIEYEDNNRIDFIDENVKAIKMKGSYFINAEYEINKDKDIDFKEITNDKLINTIGNELDDIQILYIKQDDKRTKWYRYYKPINRISDSICNDYMNNKKRNFKDICEKYEPFYYIYKHNLLLVPTKNKIENKDKYYRGVDLNKGLYWNNKLVGWTTSKKNEELFINNGIRKSAIGIFG